MFLSKLKLQMCVARIDGVIEVVIKALFHTSKFWYK